MLGLITFGLYKGDKLNKTTLILYQATTRNLWALSLGYIIFACAYSQGGVINDILCWKAWTPLSRLSFSAYLVHVNVILTFVSFVFIFKM